MCGLHWGHGLCSVYTYGFLNLFLLLFVYFKAEDYGMDAILWIIVVLFFGPVGFALFLFFAMSQTRVRGRADTEGRSARYIPGQDYVPDKPHRETTRLDSEFRDEQLEALIADEEFGKARAYLREMIQIARDTQDDGAVRNYSKYSPRINNAAMDAEKRRKQNERM